MSSEQQTTDVRTGGGTTQVRKGRVRWIILLLLFVGTAIVYIDRANIGVAAPQMRDELGLSSFQMGLILSGFFWTYAIFQLVAGYFVDRSGTRLGYTFAAVWWSVFTAATALGRGFGSLMALRLMLGVGEAPAYPCNAKAVREWFPKRERALATSIFDSGARVGTALAVPIVALLVATLGWRESFLITGSVGLVWAVVWFWFYRRPREHTRASTEEIRYIEQDPETRGSEAQRKIRWRQLLQYRAVWAMMLGNFCIAYVIYWFVTWFPSYLVEARDFNLVELGAFGSIPAWVAVPTGWLGGYVSDRMVRRSQNVTVARKTCIIGGLLVSVSIVFSIFTSSAAVALVLMSCSYGALTFANASVWSLPGDLAPTGGHVASMAGLMNFAGNAAGVSVSAVTGVLLSLSSGSYVLPLLVAGAFVVVGMLTYLVLMPPIEPLESRATTEATG